jgi:hypothetical protein
MSDRRLWIDTTGKPVITTTPNGAKNARRWGWTEAQAVPIDDADHEKAVRERIAQDILAEANHDVVRNATLATAARIAREGA